MIVAALAVTVLMAGTGAVAAGTDEPTAEERAASIVALDAGIEALDPGITPVESVVEKGDTTVVTLQADVLFAFASADLSDAAKAKIAELVAEAPEGVALAVDGHTDSVGEDAENLTLSQQRAQNVAAVVSAARPDLPLTVTGHGESRPVADNETGGQDNPDGRALNRRVELTYEG